jgi:hypothetical protein
MRPMPHTRPHGVATGWREQSCLCSSGHPPDQQMSLSSRCRVAGWLAALLFSAGGAWILLPSRNVRGNTLFESKMNSCTLHPSGISVSLFVGDGGAMTSFWFSVTERAPWSPFRHQIFYAYATPIIAPVRCRPGDTLDIVVHCLSGKWRRHCGRTRCCSSGIRPCTFRHRAAGKAWGGGPSGGLGYLLSGVLASP